MAQWKLAVVVCLASLAVPYAAADASLALIVDPRTTRVGSVDLLDETLEQVADSVSVIPRQEIELRQQPFVSDLLRTIPGVDVVQTGSRGGTTSVFIRGNNSEHTLVLLDGVPVNDPSSPGRTCDFANLSTDNVERIEVLRGPQSVVYGSDAIGGVINVVTRKGEGPFAAKLSAEAGSYRTSLGRAELAGSSKYLDYSLSGSRFKTLGIPSAGSDYGNTIKDGYLNETLSALVGIKPSESLRLELSARNTYADFHIPFSGGAGGDDPDFTAIFNETDLAARGALSILDGRLVQKSGVALAAQNRIFLDNVDALHPADSSQSSSYGRTIKFNYQAIAELHEANTLTAGVEAREETARTDFRSQGAFGPFESVFDYQKARTDSLFVEDLVKVKGRFFVSVGGRHDRHDRFGAADTYRVAPSLLIPETKTKLKASVGTGFKAPSLYQLYSSFGSLTLSPERSSAWDAGIEQDFLGGAISVGATYFRNCIRDLIAFNDATFVYYNVGRARTEGYELTSQVKPANEVALKSNFTYTSAVDLATGQALVRRPRIKFGSDVEAHPSKVVSVDVGATYTGPRVDNDFSAFPPRRVVLGGYGLWHAAGSYAVSKRMKITARIDNLFNKRYEEIEGFGTMGVAGYGGLRLEF